MDNQKFRNFWLAFYGAGLITLGIILLSQGHIFVRTVTPLIGLVTVGNGVHRIVKTLTGKDSIGSVLGIVQIGTGILTFLLPNITVSFLTVIFAVYIYINALVKFVDASASVRNRTNDFFADVIGFVFFFIFATIILFGAFGDGRVFLVTGGIYCVLYGVTQLNDFLRNVIPGRAKRAMRRRIRVSVPLFISSFIPVGVLKNYQKRLDAREIDVSRMLKEEKKNAEGKTPNIHVLIHVSGDGVGMMGHCDIRLGDKVMSYGNYDESSSRLFGGVGDGVMFISDFETYIKYSIENDGQMIFDYGICFDDKQLENVLAEIELIKKNVYEWKPPYCAAKEKDENAELCGFKDYCSRLWDGTHAEFYKFSSGKFKSYCVMSTNCVLLADSILSKASIDIIKISGIITPGAYFDYMQTEYSLDDGIVITRDIYCKENLPDVKSV